LPADVADFTGRADEVEFLCRALLPSASRRSAAVAAITGAGGIGKTFKQVIELQERIGDRRGVGVSLIGLGDARKLQGDRDAAVAAWCDALTILRELRDDERVETVRRRPDGAADPDEA
jgi:hypothetical protein